MTHDELIQYLDSDDNQYGLDSIATHGFLTATVVGKPLPNWLSVLFEGEDKQVAQPIKDALQHWQQELLAQLKAENPIELPFNEMPLNQDDDFDQDDENFEEEVDLSPESDISAWSVGFVDAMYGDEAVDWFDDKDTCDDVATLTLPMIVFSGIDEEDEDLQGIRQDDDILVQMANNLEENITELFLLFHTDE